jgi:predicted Zn-dependent protease
MVTVRVLHQARDVAHRVGRFRSGTKSRPAYVNGIRTMINGFDTELGIFCRGQQFKVFTGFLHGQTG